MAKARIIVHTDIEDDGSTEAEDLVGELEEKIEELAHVERVELT